MGLRDRATSGLIKRLIADGIPPALAEIYAEADYPSTPWPQRLPRAIVGAKQAGAIIEVAISTGRGGEPGLLLARLSEPDGGAMARTRHLAHELYGRTPADLVDRAHGSGAAAAMGLV